MPELDIDAAPDGSGRSGSVVAGLAVDWRDEVEVRVEGFGGARFWEEEELDEVERNEDTMADLERRCGVRCSFFTGVSLSLGEQSCGGGRGGGTLRV
jgi:hypothetical protein